MSKVRTLPASSTGSPAQTREGLLDVLLTAVAERYPQTGKFPTPIPGLFVARRAPCEQLCGGHEEPTLFLQLSGRRRVGSREAWVEATRGDLLRLAFEQKFAIKIDADEANLPMWTLGLTIERDRMMRLLATLPPYTGEPVYSTDVSAVTCEPAPLRTLGLFWEAFTLMERFEREGETPILRRQADTLVDYFHLALLGSSWAPTLWALYGDANPTIKAVAEGIRLITRSPESDVSLEALSEQIGLTPSVFTRHARSMLGLTPLQYRKEARLIVARGLVLEGSMSAERIAFGLGYTSTSQFFQDYKRKFGISPKASLACP